MASRGPDPNPPLDRYVETVRTLHATNPEMGVPVDAVAVALDIHRETARKYLKRLVDVDRLTRKKARVAKQGDPWYYHPAESG